MRMSLRAKMILGLTFFGFLLLVIGFSMTYAVLNVFQDTEQEGLLLVIIIGVLIPVIVLAAFAFSRIFIAGACQLLRADECNSAAALLVHPADIERCEHPGRES